jgi:hypothetical protein
MGPYKDRCVPFQIRSNQLNLSQVDSNEVEETSRRINGNRMHLSSILSLIAKGLNTYVNKVFLFIICNKVAKIEMYYIKRVREATVFLGTFNASEMFWYLSQICASTQSCLRTLQTVPSTS